MRPRIVELLNQHRRPWILLVKAHPVFEMLLRLHELSQLVACIQQRLVPVDLENAIRMGFTKRQEFSTDLLGRALLH